MSIREFIRRHDGRIELVVDVALVLLVAVATTIYFNSTPQPSRHASIGSVVIELGQLDYRLQYGDLQQAGLFTGRNCRKCDFSQGLDDMHHQDFRDPSFMGTLSRSRDQLWLHFYGTDIPAGKRTLQLALQSLRASFPGSGDAIQELAPGTGAQDQIVTDLLLNVRGNARVQAGVEQILEDEGFRLTRQRREFKGKMESMTVLADLRHERHSFVFGQLRYWPGRPQYEASLAAMRRDMPDSSSGEDVRQLLIRLRSRLSERYGDDRLRVRSNVPLK